MKKWQLFITFFKIGAFTFGGGLAMVPLIQDEVVNKKKWITDTEMVNMIAIAESTPGVLAVNTATFVGCKVSGVLGGIVATLGVILPSFLIISIISLFIKDFLENQYVANAFKGIRAGVAILIFNAGLKIFKKTKKTPVSFFLIALGFLVSVFTNINTIYLILFGGLVGLLIELFMQKKPDKVLVQESIDTIEPVDHQEKEDDSE